jgi:hypothetical protein
MPQPASVTLWKRARHRGVLAASVKTLNLLVMYKNTLILAVVSVTVGLVISYTAAFALTRRPVRHLLRADPAVRRRHDPLHHPAADGVQCGTSPKRSNRPR